ncbi:hypothetical protein [Flavobacterium sp.]|uniref:hypothetical protein n=1 Tax=Flavobacterium sp. TaxID=239 RepID=UPI0025F2FFA2|nr:hypothetical protein [Flavobacterium sp.]
MKTNFKVGQKVYWQEEEGYVLDIIKELLHPIVVKFKWGIEYLTEDGRYGKETPPVLSHTPYTLNGFSQVQEIEKDTLVYVRNHKEYHWQIRYYSHFEDGNHLCFDNQKKSTEADKTVIWKYCQTENPLL